MIRCLTDSPLSVDQAARVVDAESPKRWHDLVIETPNDHSLTIDGAGPHGAWLNDVDFRSTGSSSRDELR